MSLYTSESDTISVYLQPSFNAAASTPRQHQHHLYLIKYQGDRLGYYLLICDNS